MQSRSDSGPEQDAWKRDSSQSAEVFQLPAKGQRTRHAVKPANAKSLRGTVGTVRRNECGILMWVALWVGI
jgi:hypothetical protein